MKSNIWAALAAVVIFGIGAEASSQNASAVFPTFSFVPNQLACNAWYRPGNPPLLINGHLDPSFGKKELWPRLLINLKRTRGTFSIFAAEIGYLSSKTGLLPLLRSQHIPISVEMPGFTQNIPGDELAQAEIYGNEVDGRNIFSTIFGISGLPGRVDPTHKGWFVTADGKPFIPDEILFDERIPNLLQEFDPEVLAHFAGDWNQRKTAARKPNGSLVSDLQYAQQLQTLMQDYVKYLKVAKQRWGAKMPAVGIHWNVNPGWEWRDEAGLDTIHKESPVYFNTPANFWLIISRKPQYNSVAYLNNLIEVLTIAGFKPRTVYMDVDWTYDVPYITEVLNRHKDALKIRGVQMGINVVEASLGDHDELVCDSEGLKRRPNVDETPNELYENTLLAIMQYLRQSGIYTSAMQMRVGSWSHRPYETESGIDEKTPGSLAHTANQIANMLRGESHKE